MRPTSGCVKCAILHVRPSRGRSTPDIELDGRLTAPRPPPTDQVFLLPSQVPADTCDDPVRMSSALLMVGTASGKPTDWMFSWMLLQLYRVPAQHVMSEVSHLGAFRWSSTDASRCFVNSCQRTSVANGTAGGISARRSYSIQSP